MAKIGWGYYIGYPTRGAVKVAKKNRRKARRHEDRSVIMDQITREILHDFQDERDRQIEYDRYEAWRLDMEYYDGWDWYEHDAA